MNGKRQGNTGRKQGKIQSRNRNALFLLFLPANFFRLFCSCIPRLFQPGHNVFLLEKGHCKIGSRQYKSHTQLLGQCGVISDIGIVVKPVRNNINHDPDVRSIL